MAKDSLTVEDCNNGAFFARALSDAGFPIGFAGWLRDEDAKDSPFHFYIATPLWDVDGPVETVSLIDRFVALRGDAFGFDMHDVEIGPNTADAMRAIRELFRADLIPTEDLSEDDFANKHVDPDTLHLPRVYISKPVEGRESVKEARRAFETNLLRMEAA